MKAIQPYLNFDGNTREAMTFYQQCLGGELSIQTFGDVKAPAPPGSENRVVHARVTNGSLLLMASDTMPGHPYKQGNNFSVSIECSDTAEQDRHFNAFSKGGQVMMPLGDMFWGARFGAVTDKFGINWMFNCELPKK